MPKVEYVTLHKLAKEWETYPRLLANLVKHYRAEGHLVDLVVRDGVKCLDRRDAPDLKRWLDAWKSRPRMSSIS